MKVTTPGTIIFDNHLLSKFLTFFPPPIQKSLISWNKARNPITQSQQASNILSSIISYVAGNLLTEEGKKRIEVIASNLHRFEGLIEEVRTGFAGKIYRDHLNHVLRTTILAIHLAEITMLSDICLQYTLPSERDKLVVASLFHDAAYPVQEAQEIFQLVRKALGDGYSVFSFDEHKLSATRSHGLHKLFLRLVSRTKIPYRRLLSHLYEQINHAAIAALEFLNCCIDEENQDSIDEEGEFHINPEAVDIATAICLHDPKIDVKIDFVKNPIAGLLIIADELQDWGRPVSYPDGSLKTPLPEIFEFETRPLSIENLAPAPSDALLEEPVDIIELIKKGRKFQPSVLKGSFQYEGPEFPLLDVIYTKYRNLQRLTMGDFPLEAHLSFPFSSGIFPYEFPFSSGIYLFAYELLNPTNIGISAAGGRKPHWSISTSWVDRSSFDIILSDNEVSDKINLTPETVKRDRKIWLDMLRKDPILKRIRKPNRLEEWPNFIQKQTNQLMRLRRSEFLFRIGKSYNYLITGGVPTKITIVRDYEKRSDFTIQIHYRNYSSKTKIWDNVVLNGDLRHAHYRNNPRHFKPLRTLLRIAQIREQKWEHIVNPANIYWFKPDKLPRSGGEELPHHVARVQSL